MKNNKKYIYIYKLGRVVPRSPSHRSDYLYIIYNFTRYGNNCYPVSKLPVTLLCNRSGVQILLLKTLNNYLDFVLCYSKLCPFLRVYPIN